MENTDQNRKGEINDNIILTNLRTGAPRCWRQPKVVWINPPTDDFVAQTATLALAA
jgi:hypothetical protein